MKKECQLLDQRPNSLPLSYFLITRIYFITSRFRSLLATKLTGLVIVSWSGAGVIALAGRAPRVRWYSHRWNKVGPLHSVAVALTLRKWIELRYGERTLDTAHDNAGMTSIIWTMLLFAGHSCFTAHRVSVLEQSDSLQNQRIDYLWQCSSSGIGSS